MRRERIYLYLPLVMVPLDIGLTLWGQSPEYWADGTTITEGNPLAAELLLIHPGAFFAAGVLWLTLLARLVAVLPRSVAQIVSVTLSQAHAWAAGKWVRILLPFPHLFLGLLFLAGAALTVLACEGSRSPANPRPPIADARRGFIGGHDLVAPLVAIPKNFGDPTWLTFPSPTAYPASEGSWLPTPRPRCI
jgi:hypothetical protein